MGRKNKGLIAAQLEEKQRKLAEQDSQVNTNPEPEVETEQTTDEPVVTVKETTNPTDSTKPTVGATPSIMSNPITDESVKRKGKEYTQPVYKGDIPDRAPVPSFPRPEISLTGLGDLPQEPTKENTPEAGKEPKQTTSESGETSEPSNRPTVMPKSETGETAKEARKKAEQAVEAAIFAWDFLWGKIGDSLELSMTKLEKKQLKGLIDLRILDKQLDDGRTVGDYIKEYNEKVREDTDPDDEFSEGLKPFLVRIFDKKGWTLSDEQYVMFKLVVFTVNRAIGLFTRHAGMMNMLKSESQTYIQEHGTNLNKRPVKADLTPKKETYTPEPVKPEEVNRKLEPETVDYELMPEGTLDTESTNAIIKNNEKFADKE